MEKWLENRVECGLRDSGLFSVYDILSDSKSGVGQPTEGSNPSLSASSAKRKSQFKGTGSFCFCSSLPPGCPFVIRWQSIGINIAHRQRHGGCRSLAIWRCCILVVRNFNSSNHCFWRTSFVCCTEHGNKGARPSVVRVQSESLACTLGESVIQIIKHCAQRFSSHANNSQRIT